MHFDELEITLGHEIEIEMARLDDVVDEAMDHRRLELRRTVAIASSGCHSSR